MRQRSSPAPRRSGPAVTVPEVEALRRQADTAAATRLLEISLGEDRAAAKAARGALHVLKLAGVVPEAVDRPPALGPLPNGSEPLAYRAWVCHPTPRGTIYVVCAAPISRGRRMRTWLAEVHLVDRELDLTEGTQPSEGFEALLESILEDDKAPSQETTVEHVRLLVAETRDLARRSGHVTPAGYRAWTESVGKPSAKARPRVYDLLDPDDVLADLSISHDPQKALAGTLREGWLLPFDTLDPWLDRFGEAINSPLALDDSQRKRLGERALEKATDEVFDADTRWVWKRMFEESAAALASMGQIESARMGLYHALQFDDRPARDIPMAVHLVRRTMEVLATLAAKGTRPRDGEDWPDDDDWDDDDWDDEPPSLIERV